MNKYINIKTGEVEILTPEQLKELDDDWKKVIEPNE